MGFCMKILHLSTFRKITAGQRKQLKYERRAAEKLESITWNVVAFHAHPSTDEFVIQYPYLFRGLFFRNLYAWWYLLLHHSKYDVVLLRHMVFDPFSLLFGFFIRNRLSVHHAKEIEELKLIRQDWRGKAASFLERFSGFVNSRQVIGILGVTGEIAEYEVDIHRAKCPAGIYPNGIDTDKVALLEDYRQEDIHIAFMCGKFTPWHGLDRLLDAVESYESTANFEGRITIHLIGTLNPEQLLTIRQLDLKYCTLLCHGQMKVMEYRDILAKCDLGLGSLSLDLQGLTEATTLKVREYLSSGMPVYAAFKDAAIPKKFPYYFKGPVDMNYIINYALEMKQITRDVVRKESIPYIEKYNIMIGLCKWLKESI